MLSCTEALQEAYQLALKALPADTHGRLANALTLVERGQVVESEAHGWAVASQSTPGQIYQINGTGCPCDWAHFHPGNRCTHMLAVLLQRKTLALLAQPDPAPEPEATVAATVAPLEPVQGIDPKFIVWIQNKPFVRHAGLLKRAHECGLVSLTVDWTYNDAELSLAHAVAVFADGRRFEENGDATPTNTNKKVAPHFRRCACTRASARALRLAMGMDLVAVEELAELE
jgi:hypothetical protein